MTSILSKYQRVPKIYIKLPSNKAYYDVDLSMDGRLAILAMNAKDELLLKSPDALLNGDAIIRIIQSCCPGIKCHPKDLLAADVEAILLAIFHSSYGDNLDFEVKCPKCEYHNSFTGSIESVLNTTKILEPPYIIDDELGEQKTKINFHLKPYTYEILTKKSLIEFENAKIMQSLGNTEISDEEKLKVFNECFNKIAEYNFEIVVKSIEKIVTPEGNVNDQIEIKSFIENIDAALVTKITELISKINNNCINNDFSAICQNKKCHHEWTTKIEFDPSRFFVQGFKR